MGEPSFSPPASVLGGWPGKPPARALVVAVALGAILLPYWWLAVQWSGEVVTAPGVQFTFTVTTFLIVLIIADSAFLIRYYQLVRRQELDYATDELRRSEEALKLAVKKLNLLSSITRHDILNQLMALGTYLELIRDSATDREMKDYLDKEQAILKTIRDQIVFTRDYEGLGLKSPVWQNVQDVIMRAAEGLDLGSVELKTDIAGLEIYADPLMERVFANLMGNAVRHGGKITRISCSAHSSGDAMVIVVSDDGNGIPVAEKENIFTRRYFQDSGYGLLLSREILGITGITITETGEPGNGARFEIHIPPGDYRRFS